MPIEPNPYDKEDKAWQRANQEDPWVLYLIVRESLNMGVGKIGVQIGHAVGMVYEANDRLKAEYPPSLSIRNHNNMDCFIAWKKESYRKIVKRADDKEWEKIKKELYCFVVKDAGLTEVDPGSETVIALWPMKKSEAPKIIKRLQNLK